MPYTTADAFFEAIWEAGVRYCFVNLGSDHPSMMEAIAKGKREGKQNFPHIITCPNEMVALALADGYARLTSKPQAVLVHVDVGTLNLGAAVHDASMGHAPVLIFAGLSPYTIEGELPGSRTEYIHWIQDIPDQQSIIRQYCRYSNEIRTGKNVKQLVNRALSFATSDPKGPVYLVGGREVMEEEVTNDGKSVESLEQKFWRPVEPTALPTKGVEEIAQELCRAEEPLILTGLSGRNHKCPPLLVELADRVPALRVLDTGGSEMCFPANHPAWLGLRNGVDDSIRTADMILVLDCDVPWIPTQCKPKDSARIYHIDSDPLKRMMPIFYINALARYNADSETAVSQISEFIKLNAKSDKLKPHMHDETKLNQQKQRRNEAHQKRITTINELGQKPNTTAKDAFTTSHLIHTLRKHVPNDTIFAIEAVTNSPSVADQIQATIPGSFINCSGGGLGWSGGGALGIKLASLQAEDCPSPWKNTYHSNSQQNSTSKRKTPFVCQIVGDGTFMFSIPSTVYWISQRYNLPILTIVLNNKGWNAPRKSLELVHPYGEGSKASNEDINISFNPCPHYADIAKAAAGGRCWGGKVEKASELDATLKEAISAVEEKGISAVVDAVLDGGQDVKFAK